MTSLSACHGESKEGLSNQSREYLGDGVYAEEDGGMIRLTGNAFSRENVIFLEHWVYTALRRWAQAHGYERAPAATDVGAHANGTHHHSR